LALLLVRDTGSGIAPEHLPHVFERFFRADRDRSRDGSGAGLGLALCLSIARAHGGDIRIDSDAGNGTRVAVRLPLDRSGEPVRASDASYLSAAASASVSSLRI
jgi:signal transduction histidine kinase